MMRCWLLALPLIAATAVAGCEGLNAPLSMSTPGAPSIPAVQGYAAGEEILFIHTEASDSAIADTLSSMMRSPVLAVPELARVPQSALANVYVFANGVRPSGARGPLEFQPDVFDCPPDDACYRPLRAVNLVSWANPSRARVLKSAIEVQQALERGEIRIEEPGVVVNMPFLEWAGGER